ncbi:MAG: OmpH family outer membrane protein [Nitrospinota bacterium]|nr:MAG: OmpH family outer membrane protein [Nitrospinota bacterium]
MSTEKKRCFSSGICLLGMVSLWLGLLFSAGLPRAEGAAGKIGVIDLQRALNESIAGQKAAAELKRFRDQLAQQIEQRRQEKEKKEQMLQKLQQELRTQGLVLSEAARQKKEETYRREVRKLRRFIEDSNRFIEDANQELREKEAQLRNEILQELSKVIAKIGQERQFVLIIEKNDSVVLYSDRTIDLTDEVIRRYDAQKR